MILKNKNNMKKFQLKIIFFIIVFFLFNKDIHSQNWNLVKKAVASDRKAGDYYGYSVSIYGDYAVVGAPYEDFDLIGQNRKHNAGAVYILKRDVDGKWDQVQKLTANDQQENFDNFGFTVSIYENTIFIGSGNGLDENGSNQSLKGGSIYVFEKDSSNVWVQVQKLKSPNSNSENFGRNALKLGKNQAIIADPSLTTTAFNGGACYIFERDSSGIWSYSTILNVPDLGQNDRLGLDVDLQGGFAVISSKNDKDVIGLDSLAGAGSIYTFKKDPSGTWVFHQKIVAPDRGIGDNFGKSLAIDSNFMVIGAFSDKDDENGLNPKPFAGSVYVYKLDSNNNWIFYQKICSTNRRYKDNFGWSVSIDNGFIAVGAVEADAFASDESNPNYDSGSVHLFKMDSVTGDWFEYNKLKSFIGNMWDKFGFSLELYKGSLIIGANFEDDDELELYTKRNAGASYIFENSCNKVQFIEGYYCLGDSLQIGSNYYSSNGVYYDTLPSKYGCDSVNVYLTTQRPKSTIILNYSICEGDSVVLFNEYIKEAGLYYDTLQKRNGCDSIIIKNLTVKPVYHNTLNLQICQGDSTFLEGSYQKKSGQYFDLFISDLFCDSNVVTHLMVADTFLTERFFSFCQGQNLISEGKLQTSSGVYYDTLETVLGCDSVIINHLTILPQQIYNEFDTICFGDSLFIGGEYQYLPGIFYDTLVNQQGCDSIIRSNLAIRPQSTSTHTVRICMGDSLLLGGNYQTTSGIYIDSLVNSFGCDSIIQSFLYLYSNDYSSINTSICEGDSIKLGGTFHSTNGLYYDTLQNILGCDSILLTNLSVIPTKIGNLVEVKICNGDSILISNQYCFESGVYYDTLQSVSSCDSLIPFNVIINQLPLVYLEEFQNHTICSNDGIISLPMGFPSNGYYSGNGVVDLYFNPDLSGIGSHQVYYNSFDNNNCVNRDSSSITVTNCLRIEELFSTRNFNIYPNPASDYTIIKLSEDLVGDVKLVLTDFNGKTISLFDLNNKNNIKLNTENITEGIYLVSIIDKTSNAIYSRKKLLIFH